MEYQFEKNKLFAYLGKELETILKQYKCFIAGGTITSLFCNREINDIDIYFRDETSMIEFLNEVWEDNEWIISQTKKAILLKYEGVEIQLIHFDYFNSAEDIFNTFDFTACMGAFDFKTEDFILHTDFMKHNSQRILKFNKNTSFPIVSLLRVQKYQEKGYKISKPEFIRIVLGCMKLEINSYDELKGHLGGMYGINYDKLFENIKDEEFSLEQAIDIIADINLHEDYFTEPTPVQFKDIDDIVESISKRPVKYFEINDDMYKLNHVGLLHSITEKPSNGELIEVDDYFNNTKFYKFVKKRDNRYFSYWDKSFEYTIGEVVEAKNYTDPSSRAGLYFNELSDIRSSSYTRDSNRALIEVEFSKEDFIDIDSFIRTKRCKVLREVPEEEYRTHLSSRGEILTW